MKRMLSVLLLLCLGVVPALADRASFLKGTIASISSGSLQLDEHTFKLAPRCRVIVMTMRDGSWYELDGNLHDVRAGQSVYVKIRYDTAEEIKIER